MDDRQFDDLSRRIGVSPLSRLPRRGLIAALGGATVASVLHLDDDAEAKKNKKCKKEGQGCDKKKCKKKDKKCCCSNLKCQNDVCTGKGGSCPTTVTFQNTWNGSQSGEILNSPWGITYDNNGRVYVTDTNNQQVQVFDATGTWINTFGTTGSGNNQFDEPLGIAYNVDSGGNRTLTISDPGQGENNQRLRQYDLNGDWNANIGQAGLTNPAGVTADDDNRIWVVNAGSPGRIFLYNANGSPVFDWTPSGGGQLTNPQGIAVYRDSQNSATYVYVTDSSNNRVVKFQYTGNSSGGLAFVNTAGSVGSGASQFQNPTGIAVDDCGNLWVADRSNSRVQILDKDLNFKTRFTASMSGPNGVAVNGSTLYVVNRNGNNVQHFSLS
jgi:hypothetical protein